MLGEREGGRNIAFALCCVWLGFFEWVCWGAMRQATTLILFGSAFVDVRATFAPALPCPGPGAPVHRVGAVRVVEGGAWRSACTEDNVLVDVNHFAIGLPIAGVAASAVETAITAAPDDGSHASLAAAKAGWGLKATVCQGDCAVDVMAYHDGRERCADTWKGIRLELEKFMHGVAGNAVWQDILSACQEKEPSWPSTKKPSRPSTKKPSWPRTNRGAGGMSATPQVNGGMGPAALALPSQTSASSASSALARTSTAASSEEAAVVAILEAGPPPLPPPSWPPPSGDVAEASSSAAGTPVAEAPHGTFLE